MVPHLVRRKPCGTKSAASSDDIDTRVKLQRASKQSDVGKIKQVAVNLRDERDAKAKQQVEERGKAKTFSEKITVLAENLQKILPEGEEAAAVSREDVAAMSEDDLNEVSFQCASAHKQCLKRVCRT